MKYLSLAGVLLLAAAVSACEPYKPKFEVGDCVINNLIESWETPAIVRHILWVGDRAYKVEEIFSSSNHVEEASLLFSEEFIFKKAACPVRTVEHHHCHYTNGADMSILPDGWDGGELNFSVDPDSSVTFDSAI